MKIGYIAFDGKVFDTELACLSYENASFDFGAWETDAVDPTSPEEIIDIKSTMREINKTDIDTIIDCAEIIYVGSNFARDYLISLDPDLFERLEIGYNFFKEGNWISADELIKTYKKALDALQNNFSLPF